ncbi:NAD-dependent epimerase/dehydratase family protein [candidate division GN15 bacterium]|nr:NAD-dependent epimerase/dehydratase family protein [candidate division GN15 bacterium]
MNVLVIGGTRFMGPHVVRQLTEAGHTVMVYHRGESHAPLPDGVAHLHGDRAELSKHADAIDRFAPDIVLDMILLTEQDAVRCVNFFTGRTGRLVVVSSADVYRNMELLRKTDTGPVDPARLTEESPLRQNFYPYRTDSSHPSDWLYDYDKILVEGALRDQANLPWSILRLPMVYGPGDRQHRLFPYLKRMDDHRPAILMATEQLTARWCRGFVENVASAITLAVTDKRAANRVYNVAEPEALTEKEWVEAIGVAAGWHGEIIGLPEDKLPAHLTQKLDYRHHLDLDSSRIREELGYEEPVLRAEALRRTIEWQRANPPEAIKDANFDYDAEGAAIAES